MLLQTLLSVGDPLHFDTLLLDLIYGYIDQRWASMYLLNTLGLLINFLLNLRTCHDNSLLLGASDTVLVPSEPKILLLSPSNC